MTLALLTGTGDRVEKLYKQLLKDGKEIRLVPRDIKSGTSTLEKYVEDTKANEFYQLDWTKESPDEMYYVNVEQTWIILNALKDTGCQLNLVIDKIDENTIYGATILAAIQLAMAFGKRYNMDIQVLRMK